MCINLMDNYNTPEKVLETLALLEENGVNTIIADPRKKPMDIFKKHWNSGGKIQWIAEGHPTPEDLHTNIKASIDWGASAVYLQGVIGDRWLKAGHVDQLGECVEFIKSQGVPGGLGAHMIDVIDELGGPRVRPGLLRQDAAPYELLVHPPARPE